MTERPCSRHSRASLFLPRSFKCRSLLGLLEVHVIIAVVAEPPRATALDHPTQATLLVQVDQHATIRLSRLQTPVPHKHLANHHGHSLYRRAIMPMVDSWGTAGFSEAYILPMTVDLTLANKTRTEITGTSHEFDLMVDIGIVPVDIPLISPLSHFPPPVLSTDGPQGPRNQQNSGLCANNAGCVSALAESIGPDHDRHPL